jgi:hypothetical protein
VLRGWGDELDGILGGDLTAALAYVTPAGGAVVTAVAPLGLRDREAGVVGFTTSLGFGRKLTRIRSDARVALAYHARTHGFSDSPRYLLVQGRATAREPDRPTLEALRPNVERFLGAPKRGRLFWDRWLSVYYADRVLVDVAVERILTWPAPDCRGAPGVIGAPVPAACARPQAPPRGGTAPRVDVLRAERRLAHLPHRLLAALGADGFPVVLPFAIRTATSAGIELTIAGPGLDPGGRRAGLLAHDYRAQLVGLSARQHTGWLTVGADRTSARYAPHTERGFAAPANKTLLLLANGYLARRGARQAARARAQEREAQSVKPPR